MLGMVAQPGRIFAAPGDAFRPYVGLSMNYDDNLMRFSDREAARAVTGSSSRSDTSVRGDAGLLFENEISLQRIIASVNVNRTAYNRYSELDYTGHDLQAKWNWHLGSHLEGNVGVSHMESLSPFTEQHRLIRSLRTQKKGFVDGTWLFHPSWRLRGALSHYELTHDQVSQKSGDRKESVEEFGIDYLPSTGSSIGVLQRYARGTFDQPFTLGSVQANNNYEQDELKLNVDYRYSGKIRLQFLGGWVERQHDYFPERDSKGMNARTIVTWAPTGKLSFGLNFWREIGAVDDVTTSYTLNRGISLQPVWKVTSKIQFEGMARYETRDYQGSIALLPDNNRSDINRMLSLNLNYQPMQNIQLSAGVTHDERDSNQSFNEFRSNGMSVNGRIEF